VNNGTDPVPFAGLGHFAGDLTYLTLEPGHANCFAKNGYATLAAPGLPPIVADGCR